MRISEAFDEMVGDNPTGFNVVEYIRVETTTDACQVLSDGWSLTNYIKQYGDVEVEYDTYYKKYTVPAHTHQRLAYIALKAAHCAKYGSN